MNTLTGWFELDAAQDGRVIFRSELGDGDGAQLTISEEVWELIGRPNRLSVAVVAQPR